MVLTQSLSAGSSYNYACAYSDTLNIEVIVARFTLLYLQKLSRVFQSSVPLRENCLVTYCFDLEVSFVGVTFRPDIDGFE